MNDIDNDNGDVHPGLEGIAVAETRLSEVDGEEGRLIIAGEDVRDAVDAWRFEELALRLLRRAATDGDGGAADVGPSVEEWNRWLGSARELAYRSVVEQRGDRLASFSDPMDALRFAVASLEDADDDWRDAAEVLGAVPVANAAWSRERRGLDPVEPAASADHAEDALRMLGGESPPPKHVEALERYLMAVADHGMNASTFTARVVASTGSDLVSAATGAVGALKGPLHGGAPGPVLDMLDAVDTADSVEGWLRGRLDDGERIMGMGHRVYRVRDPRAAVFEETVERLRSDASAGSRLELAREVEEAAERVLAERHPERDLRANVEFYTAVLLEAVGIPRELFTNTFAAGRAAGWAAHVLEQRRTGRLIRPRSVFVDER